MALMIIRNQDYISEYTFLNLKSMVISDQVQKQRIIPIILIYGVISVIFV
jgi:hypothetical protein